MQNTTQPAWHQENRWQEQQSNPKCSLHADRPATVTRQGYFPKTAFGNAKGRQSHSKRPSFASWKTAFCNATGNMLTIKKLRGTPESAALASH